MRSSQALRAAVVMCGAFLLSCGVLGVRGQREAYQNLARIRGEVRAEGHRDAPLVVVLGNARQRDANAGVEGLEIIDHFPLERAGSFAFAVSPGRFQLAAFADLNSNLIYDPGEPILAGEPPFDVAPQGVHDGLELVIPADSTLQQRYDIRKLQARTPKQQQNFSLGRFSVRGDVVELSDKRFDAESGWMGMWRFVNFLFEKQPGVYFLEEYDPNKIPVLFVHGISGYPQQFSTLIERMDRERFQPWFYFYPSGLHLDTLADHLTESIAELQILHGFDDVAVVAHSMGGLVSRAFILNHFEQTGRHDIKVFVAISAPWGGSEAARHAANAPDDFIVYSWLDMAPESEFLEGLFRQGPNLEHPRPLPDHLDFHMIFGYKRKGRTTGPSGDSVVTVKSETRLDAVEAAKSILPLDYDHTSIVRSDEASKRLNLILGNAF